MATKKTTQPAAVHDQPAITEAAPKSLGTDTTMAKAAELETTGAEVPGNHQRTIPFKGKGAATPRSKKQGKRNTHSAAIQAETTIPKSQKPAPQPKKVEFQDNKLSALDAAAKVLQESGQPMNCQEMIAAMASKGYWSSPAGQTPASTLYAALSREIKIKGNQARFQKTAFPGLRSHNIASSNHFCCNDLRRALVRVRYRILRNARKSPSLARNIIRQQTSLVEPCRA